MIGPRTPLLESWMRQYYGLGMCVVPTYLYRKDGRKIPDFGKKFDGTPRHWNDFIPQLPHAIDALKTFESYRGVSANALSLLTGPVSNLIVIDTDDDKAGLRFLESIGVLIYADTYRIESQSGKGAHYYFRWDTRLAGLKTTSSKTFGKDIPVDFRGEGGLVFCPPSAVLDVDKDTTTYYRLPDTRGGKKLRIYPFPEKLVQFFLNREQMKRSNTVANATACTKSLSELSEKQRAWVEGDIKKLEETAKGLRSEECFKVVCTCIKLNISPDNAYSLLAGKSKFAERDKKYFDDMYQSALSHVDLQTPKEERISKTPAERVLEITNRPDVSKLLSHRYSTDMPELVARPFLYKKSVIMMAGDPGTGKSILSLALSKAAAEGTDCWDRTIIFEKPCRILYFHGDLNAAIFNSNYLQRMGLSVNDQENIKFQILSDLRESMNLTTKIDVQSTPVTVLDIVDPRNLSLYQAFIDAYRPDIVILDTLSSFCSIDECDRNLMRQAMLNLKTVASAFNHLLLILHHARKRMGNEKKPQRMSLDDVRGSGALAAQCDMIIGVSRLWGADAKLVKSGGDLHILKDGAFGAETKYFQEFRYVIRNTKDMSIRLDTYIDNSVDYQDPDPQKPMTVQQEDSYIVKYVYESKPRSIDVVNMICKSTGVTLQAAYHRINKLIKNGLLEANGPRNNRVLTTTANGYSMIVPSLNEVLELKTPEQISKGVIMDREAVGDPVSSVSVSDDDKRAWYADRTHYDEPKDFPVEVQGWETLKDKHSEEEMVRHGVECARTLIQRRDKFGNMMYSDFSAVMKNDFDFDMCLVVVKDFVDHDQLWYHTIQGEGGKLKDIVLHAAKPLEVKYFRGETV